MSYTLKRAFLALGNLATVNPAVVGEAIESISKRHNGAVTPEVVVEASKPKTAPLHNYFEWDDSIAGQRYRLDQARYLIRAVVQPMKIDGQEIRTRAFVRVPSPENGVRRETGDYRPIRAVLSNKESRATLLRQALSEHKAWGERYAMLTELHALRHLGEKLLLKYAADD